MKKILFIIAAAISASAMAAPGSLSGTPAEAVAHYFRATEHNDPVALGKAFQPSAMMYWLDDTGAMQAMTQYRWKARMKAAGAPKPGANTNTVRQIDAGPETAIVIATAKRGEKTYTDYMLLLRLSDGWKIVAKVFADAGQNVNVEETQARVPVEAKLSSDGDWNVEHFQDSMLTRASVFSVEDRQMVSASVPEWAARYIERKAAKQSGLAASKIEAIETTGAVGYAHWSITASDGSIWHDRALLIREGAHWKIAALSYSGMSEPTSKN